jgi:hypothetical protein
MDHHVRWGSDDLSTTGSAVIRRSTWHGAAPVGLPNEIFDQLVVHQNWGDPDKAPLVRTSTPFNQRSFR